MIKTIITTRLAQRAKSC